MHDIKTAFNTLLPFDLFGELSKNEELTFEEIAAIINLQCNNKY